MFFRRYHRGYTFDYANSLPVGAEMTAYSSSPTLAYRREYEHELKTEYTCVEANWDDKGSMIMFTGVELTGFKVQFGSK